MTHLSAGEAFSMRSRVLGSVLGSLLLSLAAGRAAAQQPVPLPPLEVVATRIPHPTHEVPASIEVLRGSDLRARGATSLRDALALAAGVAIAPGGDGGPAGSVPEFWGLREFDAFLLVVDGIPWGGAFNPALSSLNLQDVDRIEVLRGPAPVTYGATSFVGVIHVVHSAAAATSRRLGLTGGSYGSFGAQAELGIPMRGSWSSRLSADLDRSKFKDERTDFTRGHALWRTAKVDGEKSLWFLGDVTINRQDPASPHPREGAALSSAVPLDANHNPDGAFLNENRFVLSAGWTRPVGGGSQWGSQLAFTHSTSNMFRGFLTDLSNSPDNASGFKEDIDLNDLYADTHLIWSSASKLRFLTGADALFANGEAKGATFTYTVPLDGSTATPVPIPSTLDKDAEARRLFLGAYGSAEWRPTERVTLSGGLRLNATNERRGEGESVSNTRLSGSVGALVGLWEQDAGHLRVFANFRDTFKPAAFDFSLAENEGVLEPETSQAYEAGLKLRTVNGRGDFEASVFRMDFKNLVTSTVVNNLPSLQNAGKTRFQGVELATDWRLRDDLSARATYSFHDGKFVDFVQDFGGTNTQLAGKRFEMSARHLASGGFTYAPASGFLATANLNYTGDRYLNKRNTALVKGFATFDAGVGYRFRRAEIRVDGRNLGNRRDAVSESEFGDAQYYRMTARSIRGSVALQF
jgi:outer membrane receptor protein involved in Fe transport